VTELRRNRDFVLLQVGQALSTVGTESTAIAYPLLVLSLTHSPAKAGLVGFARILPYPLFALLAGVAVDRWNRKRLMLLADLVRVAGVSSIVVALALGDLGFAQVALVAFVEGTCFVLFNIAEVGALRAVVPARQLPRAAAVEQSRISAVVLTGPPLGGALFGVARALPFVVDAFSYAFSMLSLLAMRTPFQERRERSGEPMRTEIREGLVWLWHQRFLRSTALLAAGTNFAFEGIFLTLVVIGRRQGLSGGEIGGLIAAFGAASLVGSVVAPFFQRTFSMRAIVVGSSWVALPIAAFLFEPSVYVLLASALPLGFFIPTISSTVIGYRNAIVPDRLVGRVNSVARNVALVAQPLGPLAAGLLLAHWSAQLAVGVFVGWLAALAVWATASPSIRHAPSLAELEDDEASVRAA
jgi:MFS family permease